jgi:hypothetical protein
MQGGNYVIRVSITPQRKIFVALWLHYNFYGINQNKKGVTINIRSFKTLNFNHILTKEEKWDG